MPFGATLVALHPVWQPAGFQELQSSPCGSFQVLPESGRVDQERNLSVPSPLLLASSAHGTRAQHPDSAAEPGKRCRKQDLKENTRFHSVAKDICLSPQCLQSTGPSFFFQGEKKKKGKKKNIKKNFALAFTISKIKRTIHNNSTVQSYCKNC